LTELIIPEIMVPAIYDVNETIQRIYSNVSIDCEHEFTDWNQKINEEKEALIWVRMLAFAGDVEDKVQAVQGAIMSHIQDYDLMRYHPGSSNWQNFNDMVRQTLGRRDISASQRSDLAFITSNIIPLILEMPTPLEHIPSMSNLRTLVPSLRIAQRQHNTQRIYSLLERASHMTNDEIELAERPREPTIIGHIVRNNGDMTCTATMTNEEFARLRRVTPWIDWQY
jgi:hypothetical protein